MWISNIDNTNSNIQDNYDGWISKTNLCLQDFDTSWNIDRTNINIIESNEIIYKEYGSYSYVDVKNIILEKYNIDERLVDETINEIKESKFNIINDLTGSLARKIIEHNNLNDDQLYSIHEDLKKLFENVGPKVVILGTFYNPTKTITLYVKAIEQHASNLGISYYQALEVTFIHELFHAFHYKNNNVELVERTDYTSEVIKESLASFFEYAYCSKYGYSISANNLAKSWAQYSVYCYPYSGAINFKNSWCNFVDIFDLSLKDMDNALRQLLDVEMFYKIKNKKDRLPEPTYVKKYNIDEEDSSTFDSRYDGIIPLKGINKVYVCKNKLSYDNEKSGGYLSAPDKPRYKILKTVQPGDIIFHIFKNQLHAVSIAQSSYYIKSNSIYVNSQYYELSNPLDISIFKNDPNYPNKKGDTHYLSLWKDYSLLNNIVGLILKIYPNEPFFNKIKEILN